MRRREFLAGLGAATTEATFQFDRVYGQDTHIARYRLTAFIFISPNRARDRSSLCATVFLSAGIRGAINLRRYRQRDFTRLHPICVATPVRPTGGYRPIHPPQHARPRRTRSTLRRSPIAVIIDRFAGDRQLFWVYGRYNPFRQVEPS